jgi:putative transposase
MPRVVVPDLPHHITQRGNYRQQVFFCNEDRHFFLEHLESGAARHGLEVLGWCLMPNHFHLIAVPRQSDSLALTLRPLLSEHSMRINALHDCVRGHLWQSRFYSCALEESRLWTALRYVELNPVRAGLVERAEQYAWSSARWHTGLAWPPALLQMSPWDLHYTPETWAEELDGSGSSADVEDLRHCTRMGRPWGDAGFIERLEQRLQRKLQPNRVGRPRQKTDLSYAAAQQFSLMLD